VRGPLPDHDAPIENRTRLFPAASTSTAAPPSPVPSRRRRLVARPLTALAAGAVTALSVPPWGFWPPGPLGLAVLAWHLTELRLGRRLLAGALFGIGLFAPTLFWMSEFHAVGYGAVVLLEASFFVVAAGLTPLGPAGRLVFPGTMVLAESARGVVPFGGLAMGGVPLGQVGGPLAPAARVGGGLLLMGLAAVAAVALADLARLATEAGTDRGRRLLRVGAALAVLGGIAALAGLATLAPDGRGPHPPRTIDVAIVQGGGPRGFRAVESDPRAVLEAHLEVSANLAPPLDLVLWPENTIEVATIADTPEAAVLGAVARRVGATVVAGVTEDAGAANFHNVAVAWTPSGEIVDRYVKVHRVPFGEYVPGRALFSRLADLSVIPRDAVAGHGPGLLATPVGRLGVAISFEVFFAERGRAAARAGGEVLLVPTNASSYTTSQVPTQEVAAARLRAWETGRWVVQSAPTGFGAIVDHQGRVLERTRLGEAQILQGGAEMRTGRTLYVRWGDWPVVVVAALAVVAGWVRARASRTGWSPSR
jgi:apolipoprotein N-acyltransferase